MKPVIEVSGLTKEYGAGRGVFDLNFALGKGEVFGFLGPNGAGKTTTIRQLMGFIRPQKGSARILEMDCFRDAKKIQAHVGYLPGELALPDDMTGEQFLRFMAGMKGVSDLTEARRLSDLFELDGKQRIRRMSKGTKQKLGILNAFVAKPEILILDEPTSGLDPLMQNRFLELVHESRERGATVFLSSHLFEEAERTCSRVAILRKGRIAAIEEMDSLRKSKVKTYQFVFPGEKEAETAAGQWNGAVRHGNQVEISVSGRENLSLLLQKMAGCGVTDLQLRTQTLEDMFLGYYGEEKAADRKGEA